MALNLYFLELHCLCVENAVGDVNHSLAMKSVLVVLVASVQRLPVEAGSDSSLDSAVVAFAESQDSSLALHHS